MAFEAPTCNEIMKAIGIEDVQQNNPHHFGTVFEHTNAVVSNLHGLYLDIDGQPSSTGQELLYAALLHDAAKPATLQVNPKTGYDQFFGHAEKSAEIYKENAHIVTPSFTKEQVEYTSELIRLHDTKYGKEGKIRDMLESHPNGFAADLLKIQLSDIMGQRDVTRAPKLQEVENFASRILNIGTAEQTVGIEEVLHDAQNMRTHHIEMEENAGPDSKVFLARTSDGQDIYMSAETMEHMKAHPNVDLAHVVEAIGKIDDYNGQFRMDSVDMGRTVGKDSCIEVDKDNKEVQMAYRKGREGQSRVILDPDGTKAADTSLVTIGMARDDDGRHTMFTSFYGQLAPKEPWDKSLSPEGKAESEKFWSTHALAVPKEAIDWEKTETKEKVQSGKAKTFEELLNKSVRKPLPGKTPIVKNLKAEIENRTPEKKAKENKEPKEHSQAKKKTAPTAPGVR